MCNSSVFEAREDFVLPVSIPYRHRLGEARDHGGKEKQSKSLAWWVSCMSWKSMLHKMSFFCPWNRLKDRNGVKNFVTNKNEVDAFSSVCLFSSCAARQVSLVSPNLLLPWGSVPVSASGLFSSEMLTCFIVLFSSFCKCQRLLIFLGLFSFVRKRTWIKLSMHDIY